MADLHADDDYLDRYQFEHDPFLGRGPSFKFLPLNADLFWLNCITSRVTAN